MLGYALRRILQFIRTILAITLIFFLLLNILLGDAALVGMLSNARERFFTAPWISILPGMAIFVTVLGLNLLGDGRRDILDPHPIRRRG
jgi:peptide/nickel transport system permease protein